LIIWILNHHAAPIDNSSRGTRHFDLGVHLAKKGHKVRIFAANRHHTLYQWVEFEGLYKEVPYEGGLIFTYVQTRPYQGNTLARFLNMLDYRRNVVKVGRIVADREHPDVIIASSVHPLAWEAGYDLAKEFGVRYFAEVRDIWPKALVDTGKMGKFHPLVLYFSILEKRAYKRAEAVITLLRDSEGYIKSKGAKKVIWIPNGIDLERFDSLKEKPDEQLKKIIDEMRKRYSILIGYAGGHSLVYGLETLVEVAEICQNEELPVGFISVGDGEALPRLKDMVEEKRLNNLVFAGRFPRTSIPWFLCQMDALFVHMKPMEVLNYGVSYNKLFEYFAAGKPVVYAASWGEALKDMLDSDAILIAKPGDAESVVVEVDKLLQNVQKYVGTAQVLRRKVTEFDFTALSEKLLKLLEGD